MFLNYFVKIADKHDHYTRSVTGIQGAAEKGNPLTYFVNSLATDYNF